MCKVPSSGGRCPLSLYFPYVSVQLHAEGTFEASVLAKDEGSSCHGAKTRGCFMDALGAGEIF